MTKHEVFDHLAAIEQPSLEPSRRAALYLLRMASEMRARRFPEASNKEENGYLELSCVNCDKPLTSAKLYCSDYCQQFAKLIRYVRKAIAKGRIAQPDVQDAIGTRLLMLAGGGYPHEQRRVSARCRAEIFERDGYRCKVCGSPATDIDHISGNSDEPSNLRALCKACNIVAAWRNAHIVSHQSDPEAWHRIERIYRDLAQRIAAPTPLRFCDDDQRWDAAQREMRVTRRRLLQEREEEDAASFEDVDGYVNNAMQKDD